MPKKNLENPYSFRFRDPGVKERFEAWRDLRGWNNNLALNLVLEEKFKKPKKTPEPPPERPEGPIAVVVGGSGAKHSTIPVVVGEDNLLRFEPRKPGESANDYFARKAEAEKAQQTIRRDWFTPKGRK